jgi:tol-pal system protein YbgF
MRIRNIVMFAAAGLAGMIVGSLMGPRPVGGVSREMIDLQRDVTTLLQGQKDMSTQITTDNTVIKTLLGQSNDNVNKLSGTMGVLQKSVQDVQANSGARLDTMSTQVQGLSDNLEEIKSRLGKLNQQLVDLQNSVQSLDAKISTTAPATTTPGATTTPTGGSSPTAAAPAPPADMLYSNGLRDITSGKYDLARQEFLDYLKYYGTTDLAGNAQFYLGEVAYAQRQYDQAVAEYDKVVVNYPKNGKVAPALLKKGMAHLELGQKTSGIRDLREVAKRYPGTDEERRARAKLKELGVTVAVARWQFSGPSSLVLPCLTFATVT